MFQADELLLALREAHVRFVVIGGIAVGVHGYVRATKDLDIVPDPEPENLTRLSSLLRELDSEPVGAGDFSADEFPYDPTDPEQLAQRANFRLETRLGPLDIMQWVAGIDDPAYPVLAREAITVDFRGGPVLVCGLEHLLVMKQAAGRDQDLQDLRELGVGEPPDS
jgi:predicted nucleotidyltransferase